MDTNYSNYDMFDKLIVNNKKARSWTVFWVIALCLLAGAVIILAIKNSNQKKTIADLSINADYKTKVIDSLKGILQKEVDKKVDSISDYVSTLNNEIQKIEKQSAGPGNNSSSEMATQKENFKVVNNSIRELNNKLQRIKTDFKKDRLRIFIQYNEKENTEAINKLSSYLKRNEKYFVAPVELVQNEFPTLIKVYNYSNKDDEIELKEMISNMFNISPKNIGLAHISDDPSVTKPTIEIWISTSRPQVKQANPASKS